MELAELDVDVQPTMTVRNPGAADWPLNGVLRSTVAVHADLPPLRPWRDALADYLDRAGLRALAVHES